MIKIARYHKIGVAENRTVNFSFLISILFVGNIHKEDTSFLNIAVWMKRALTILNLKKTKIFSEKNLVFFSGSDRAIFIAIGCYS
jgi:hypothetical protein